MRQEKVETEDARRFSSARAKWKGVKLEKSTFKPSFYKLKDIHGQSFPLDKKADGLAEYLEKRHWACIQHLPPDKVDKREVVDTQPPINIGSITIEEINTWSFTLIKNKQSPRPRRPHIRIVQISRRRHEVAGENLEPNVDWRVVSWWIAYAEVVSIYKKKATQSFLNTTVLFLCWTHHTKFWPKFCRKELQTPLISL